MPDRDGQLPPLAPLPADAVLLHIGVHKTGTTALQAALADARPELVDLGVLYPGVRPAQHRAALAAIGKSWGWRNQGATMRAKSNFDEVVRETVDWSGRTVISSEHFCEADDAAAQRIVDALGGDRVHVVITVRALGRLLPSSWQQYLKYGLTWRYEDWLHNILDDTVEAKVSPSFWKRNDLGALAERWARVVGADRVTILVLEQVDHRAIFQWFAQLLGIPESVLTSRMQLTSNRSMTAQECELLRRVNVDVRPALQWQQYEKLVRYGVARSVVEEREPGPGEERLHTPDWALDEAARRAAAHVAAIRVTGVRVVGDLDALSERLASTTPTTEAALDAVPMDVAVRALAAAVLTASRTTSQAPLVDETRILASRWKAAALSRLGRRS